MYEGERNNTSQLLHTLNRLIHPTIELSTPQEVETFLDLSKQPNEKTKFFSKVENPPAIGKPFEDSPVKTRVIMFVFEKKDMIQEYKDVKLAGRFSYKRDDLRIGVVYDRKIIKKYKSQYGNSWFGDAQYNGLVLMRHDGMYFRYNFLEDTYPLSFWINKKSMKSIEPLSSFTFRLFELVRQPMMIAFVDFESPVKKARKLSAELVNNILPEVAPAYFQGLVVTFADNKVYSH